MLGGLVVHFKVLWPWDQTHWREATCAVRLAWQWSLPIALWRGELIFHQVRARSNCIFEWAPALHCVEFLEIGMEVDPNKCLLQFWVIAEEILISMNKGLQDLIIISNKAFAVRSITRIITREPSTLI